MLLILEDLDCNMLVTYKFNKKYIFISDKTTWTAAQ